MKINEQEVKKRISLSLLGIGLVPHFTWRYIELFPDWRIGFAAGWPLLALGLLVLVWAVQTMRSAGEDFEKPTSSIVSRGPYSLSRNPIYLSMVMAYVAVALILNSAWPLFLLPLTLAVLHFGVILKEERDLQQFFGSEYASYRANVRRWI